MFPQRQRGKLRNTNTSRQLSKPVDTLTWSMSNPLRAPETISQQHRKRRGTNTTTLSFLMWQGCQMNLEEFSLRIKSQYTFDLVTLWDRNYFTLSTKFPDTNSAMLFMRSSAVRSVNINTKGRNQTTSPQTHGSSLGSQLLWPGLSSSLTFKREGTIIWGWEGACAGQGG